MLVTIWLMAAALAGASRTVSGSYLEAFVIAGAVALCAAVASLFIATGRRPTLAAA